ncbi:MAG: nitrous oxide-stimulated promoter family protein [Coriobacteriia bacterium]|nr:nitrous oxide-stimulated promoter family protein [Coriobacteriia bacterium]
MARTTDEERIARDLRTLQAIGSIYCRAHHADQPKDQAGMCPECAATIAFTHDRAASCPNGHQGNCQDCSIKCNRGDQQQRIKAIMAYAAPRMLVRHPLMTLEYLGKKMRK